MERDEKRKYPIFEQLTTEELDNLLVQDFAAMDEDGPDEDYILAIMEVIGKREAPQRQTGADAAWKEFQEQYQGRSAAFEPDIHRETNSSHRNQSPSALSSLKRSRALRILPVAALVIGLLCSTALSTDSGVSRALQGVITRAIESFGFESPFGEANSGEATMQKDPYTRLRTAVAEYTDLPVVPHWAPEGTVKESGSGVQITVRKESILLSGSYQTGSGQFVIRIRIHDKTPPEYKDSYQWDASQATFSHDAGGFSHDIAYNNRKSSAAWTNENVECMIEGDLSTEELETMIDSIYEE